MSKQYLIIIDTDSYSGNFEREMSIYLTGRHDEMFEHMVDEYRDVENMSDSYKKWFYENTSSYMFDEEYGSRMCGIWSTPGFSNDGMGKHVPDVNGVPVYKWAAYQSVAIAVDSVPSKEILQELLNRALEFANLYPKSVTEIFGVRVIEIKTSVTETDLYHIKKEK